MEEILRRTLPASAHKFMAWWSNESSMKARHTQAWAWMNAGFVRMLRSRTTPSNSAELKRSVQPSARRRSSHAGTIRIEVR
ncbi:DUF7662 domain-containing protein [Bradyrhizobium canariense]|uniref:DUF7662 domain-containing protein n=1 Tax=Bradyrhizobium canariense TaxID=255045 RepID=UPI004064B248